MLDHVHIIQRGGLVLWSKSYTSSPSPLPSFVKEALIEERADGGGQTWEKDGYSVRWTLGNDLGLIFVVAYQRIIQLTYVPDLLATLKKTFVDLYEPILRLILDLSSGTSPSPSVRSSAAYRRLFSGEGDGWKGCFKGWEEAFARLLKEIEAAASTAQGRGKRQVSQARLGVANGATTPTKGQDEAKDVAQTPTKEGVAPTDAEVIARNIAALKARHRKPSSKTGGTSSPRGRGTDSESDATPVGSRPGTPGVGTKKEARKWADSKVTEKDMQSFDYSTDKPDEERDVSGLVDKAAMGTRGKDGMYEVADFGSGDASDDDDDDDDEAASTSTSTTAAPSGPGFFSRLASSVGLSSSAATVLTPALLAPVLSSMQSQLVSKNVAKSVAEKVCESVGKGLEGKSVSGYNGVKKAVKAELETVITRILTPKTSTDVLLDIHRKRASATTTSVLPSLSTSKGKDPSEAGGAASGPVPYVITAVGVNGVGKSTTLSKVAFWLLQNRLRVLVAACDTFRSGAVEQLRVHVRNLSRLEEEGKAEGEGKRIELYERGYGRDAAGIAKDAIAYAKENKYDVVLIDTAGRMQDNEPLMRALAKLVAVNQPDKIVFVGEALVGNEAVDQLTRFDRSLRDFSGMSSASARGIDGLILTKFDTIDDKVGAALSMTYVTGCPLLFVGTGQTYTDLKGLRIASIVNALTA